MEIFCNINVFIVTFHQFNASINFFQKQIFLTPNFWTVVYISTGNEMCQSNDLVSLLVDIMSSSAQKIDNASEIREVQIH